MKLPFVEQNVLGDVTCKRSRDKTLAKRKREKKVKLLESIYQMLQIIT